MKEHSNTKRKITAGCNYYFKKSISKQFFILAFHGDTDNPHCHIYLKVVDKNGKRINPKKQI